MPYVEGQSLRERLTFVRQLAAGGAIPGAWPDLSDAALLSALPSWLGPRLPAVRRRADLARIDLTEALLGAKREIRNLEAQSLKKEPTEPER
mgnify:CR=1 FL=1